MRPRTDFPVRHGPRVERVASQIDMSEISDISGRTREGGAEPKARPGGGGYARALALHPSPPMTQLAILGCAPGAEARDDVRGGAKCTSNLSNRYHPRLFTSARNIRSAALRPVAEEPATLEGWLLSTLPLPPRSPAGKRRTVNSPPGATLVWAGPGERASRGRDRDGSVLVRSVATARLARIR